jgi:hypothetical protein
MKEFIGEHKGYKMYCEGYSGYQCPSLKLYGFVNDLELKRGIDRAIRNKARRDRDDAMRSLGMVKVRGNLGGTYWE